MSVPRSSTVSFDDGDSVFVGELRQSFPSEGDLVLIDNPSDTESKTQEVVNPILQHIKGQPFNLDSQIGPPQQNLIPSASNSSHSRLSSIELTIPTSNEAKEDSQPQRHNSCANDICERLGACFALLFREGAQNSRND
ncbi:MAG: hypothetical protein JSS09_01085 [Verrucomicrobia bacterium]|nr:hypothetical protein [Verrucomicrobiota bacterium]